MFRTECERVMAETAGQQIFQRVLPGCNAAAERCCAFWQPRKCLLFGFAHQSEFARLSPAHLALEIQATARLRLENTLEDRVWTGVRERKSSMTSPIAHGPNRGRNHGVVQACGPTTRSLANTTFRRSHATMSAASKRATIIAWGTLDGMKTVVNVNQRAVFVSIRTGIMTARDWSARPS